MIVFSVFVTQGVKVHKLNPYECGECSSSLSLRCVMCISCRLFPVGGYRVGRAPPPGPSSHGTTRLTSWPGVERSAWEKRACLSRRIWVSAARPPAAGDVRDAHVQTKTSLRSAGA